LSRAATLLMSWWIWTAAPITCRQHTHMRKQAC
jgi:hypothetical protein